MFLVSSMIMSRHYDSTVSHSVWRKTKYWKSFFSELLYVSCFRAACRCIEKYLWKTGLDEGNLDCGNNCHNMNIQENEKQFYTLHFAETVTCNSYHFKLFYCVDVLVTWLMTHLVTYIKINEKDDTFHSPEIGYIVHWIKNKSKWLQVNDDYSLTNTRLEWCKRFFQYLYLHQVYLNKLTAAPLLPYRPIHSLHHFRSYFTLARSFYNLSYVVTFLKYLSNPITFDAKKDQLAFITSHYTFCALKAKRLLMRVYNDISRAPLEATVAHLH